MSNRPCALFLLVLGTVFMMSGCGSNVSNSANASSGSSTGSASGSSGSSTSGSSSSSSSSISLALSGDASVRCGATVQFTATANGVATNAVLWSVNGVAGGNSTVGTISSSGLYTAPSAVPGTGSVAISAALTANSAVTASATESILNPVPVLSSLQPSQLLNGIASTVTLAGTGFVQGSSVVVNGTELTATYQSASSLTVSLSATATSATTVSFTVKNPNPGAGSSNTLDVSTLAVPADTAQIGLTAGRAVPQDFLGTSYEWGEVQWVLGWPSVKVNTIYRQLLSNLMDGHNTPFRIRIGGASTDQTTYPTDQTMPAFASLASDMNVHFSFGVNLASDDVNLATAQASAYLSQMPEGSVDTIEIGNEADNYGYNGQRPKNYMLSGFLSDHGEWRAGITPLLTGSTKILGPSWGAQSSLQKYLSTFETQEAKNTSVVSMHRYAGYRDAGQTYAVDYLLTPDAVAGPSEIASIVATAHNNGQKFRIAEFNSLDLGGVDGISNAFGSALWAMDDMFEYVNVGVDGVNWHGLNACNYCALTLDAKSGGPNGTHVYALTQVRPLYYGMLLFQQATANNAKLLPVTVATKSNIKVWATIDDSNTVKVLVINKDASFANDFTIALPGYGDAQATRLQAASYQSKTGVTLGGQTFDGSKDGKLLGTATNETVSAQSGFYTLKLQPTSAVLLTLKK